MKKVITILSRKQPYFNVVSTETSLDDALDKMNIENFRYLIVMDNERFLGLLSEHDIFSKAMIKKRPLEKITVGETMKTGFPIVDSEESAETCLKMMQLFKVHQLPVFDNFRFCGVISSDDILQEAVESGERTIFEADNLIPYTD